MTVKNLKMLLNQKGITDDMEIVCISPFRDTEIWIDSATIEEKDERCWNS